MDSTRIAAWLARHPLLVDIGLAVLLAPLAIGGTIGTTRAELPDGLAPLWALCFVVPVVLRRAAPDIGIAILVVGLVIQLFALDDFTPADIVVTVSLYAIGAHGRPPWRRWWLAAALVGAFLGAADWVPRTEPDGSRRLVDVAFATVASAVTALASYVLGALARQRRANVAALQDRAASLEREREQGARLAAQEERARIAREMHDIVAHSLSVIVVQADGARYLAEQENPQSPAAAALGTIGETARTALAETRRLVGVLRENGETPALAPSASLADVERLVAEACAGGLPTAFAVRGQVEPLGQAAELALYRVAQESLTNVRKHAGRDPDVTVTLAYAPESVTLSVVNTGAPATDGDGRGHGLLGMRERMTAHGGSLVARPRLGGGFEVVATLPRTDSPAGHRSDSPAATRTPAPARTTEETP